MSVGRWQIHYFYLIFFRDKLIPLTTFWKVFLWVPPVVALVFLWFALGRCTPLAQDAYVQAPVIQVAPEVGGFVTEVLVQDNQEVKRGTPLFRIDGRPYQYKVDQAKAKLIEVQENAAALLASVYAAEETVGKAEANLDVAQKNVTAAQNDLDAAQKITVEAKKQLELAESAANRGRVTVFASGGFPVVNELATILHTIFSFLDYLHPKPSLLVVVAAVAVVVVVVSYVRRRPGQAAAVAKVP